MSGRISREGKSIPEKIVEYLTTTGGDDEDNTGMNARINSEEEMQTFLLQDFLGKNGVESAEDFHKSLVKHSVAKRGLGRQEVVQASASVPTVVNKSNEHEE